MSERGDPVNYSFELVISFSPTSNNIKEEKKDFGGTLVESLLSSFSFLSLSHFYFFKALSLSLTLSHSLSLSLSLTLSHSHSLSNRLFLRMSRVWLKRRRKSNFLFNKKRKTKRKNGRERNIFSKTKETQSANQSVCGENNFVNCCCLLSWQPKACYLNLNSDDKNKTKCD